MTAWVRVMLIMLLAVSKSASFSQEEIQDFGTRSEIQADVWAADSLIHSGNTDVLNYRMSDFQVSHLNGHQLMLLRNAVFAWRGYRFENEILLSHFRQFQWYHPRFDDVSRLLAPIDDWNLQLIIHYEDRLESGASELPNEDDMIGFWHGSPAVGSGYSDRFLFFPEGRFIYRVNSMDGGARLRELSGTWYLDNSHLVLQADSAVILEGGEILEPYASYASEYVIEGGSLEAGGITPVEVFRLPVDEFTRDYSASTDQEGMEHLTVPYARIGFHGYWRICSDPSLEYQN